MLLHVLVEVIFLFKHVPTNVTAEGPQLQMHDVNMTVHVSPRLESFVTQIAEIFLSSLVRDCQVGEYFAVEIVEMKLGFRGSCLWEDE